MFLVVVCFSKKHAPEAKGATSQVVTSQEAALQDTEPQVVASKNGEVTFPYGIGSIITVSDPLIQQSSIQLSPFVNAETITVHEDQFKNILDALKSVAEHQKQHDEQFEALKQQFNLVTIELRKMKVAMRSTDSNSPQAMQLPVYPCKSALPLDTYADLETFEKTLGNEPDFIAYLLSIGGTSPERLISNLMSAVYSIGLQITMTWKGTKGPDGWKKHPLESTKTPNKIIGILHYKFKFYMFHDKHNNFSVFKEVCQASFPRITTCEASAILRKYMMHSTDRSKKMEKQLIEPEPRT